MDSKILVNHPIHKVDCTLVFLVLQLFCKRIFRYFIYDIWVFNRFLLSRPIRIVEKKWGEVFEASSHFFNSLILLKLAQNILSSNKNRVSVQKGIQVLGAEIQSGGNIFSTKKLLESSGMEPSGEERGTVLVGPDQLADAPAP